MNRWCFTASNNSTTADITDILIVDESAICRRLCERLGQWRRFSGVEFTYRVQEEAKGIAHALALAEGFANNGSIAVLLGDNIFETSIRQAADDFHAQPKGARVPA